MKIFSCETHINHALDMFVAEQKTFPMLEKLKKRKSYPQFASTVKTLHYILWLMKIEHNM